MQGCEQPVVTMSGIKAGDPLGDVFFNLIQAKVLKDCEKHLIADGLAVTLPAATFEP